MSESLKFFSSLGLANVKVSAASGWCEVLFNMLPINRNSRIYE